MTLHHGDCLEVMRGMDDNSVDSIVTDPPYGLSFMGKKWDYDVPSAEIWRECLRVLKPGGHLLAFAGTRTQHRMAVNIEDAGFEIRDMIAWVYGSGFPKSLDVSKAIDKAAGAEREVVGERSTNLNRPITDKWDKSRDRLNGSPFEPSAGNVCPITAPATDAARQWQGWGTALKPAMEPVTVARKPLIGTVAENVLAHGTGAINVDGCRVGTDDDTGRKTGALFSGMDKPGGIIGGETVTHPSGRWPANLIHDGSDEVLALFPQTTSGSGNVCKGGDRVNPSGWVEKNRTPKTWQGDTGSAARFFYCAKTNKTDRDAGLEGLEAKSAADCVDRKAGTAGMNSPRAGAGRTSGNRNHHPTVKPTALMRYLCRLVTPPGGIILDPFMGSGSTGKAAMLEGFQFVGIERDAEYIEIARARINAVKQGSLL